MRAVRVAKAALKMGWLVLPIVTVIAFVAVEAQHLALKNTVRNRDYFSMITRALQLSFDSLDSWVSSKHPFGHPGLIRLGLELGWDAERIGQGLSITGGILFLYGTYLLALSVFRDKRFAAIAQVLVATTGVTLYYASREGNDMLAAGLQLLSLGMLAASTLRRENPRLQAVFMAGLTVGLAYLIRYNGMVTCGVGGLWLVIIAINERRPSGFSFGSLWGWAKGLAESRPTAWKAVGVYGIGFLLGSAPQWIPSLVATGNPFYIDQGLNVWGLVYDQFDVLRDWQHAPPGITVAGVFAMDPQRFIRHWWGWFSSFWVDPELMFLDPPLKLFGHAGFVFLLLARGPASSRVRGLLGLFALAHLTSISMMKLTARYLLMMVPLLVTGVVYLFTSLIPPRWEYRRSILPLSIVVLLVSLAWGVQGALDFARSGPGPDTTVIEATNVLYAGGMRSADEVLNTHIRLHDTSVPERKPYVFALATPEFTSVAELVQMMRERGWRFFIYHRDDGPKIYPALKDQLSIDACPAGLAPVYFRENEKFVICRLVESLDCSPVEARFENGVNLDCYEAHLSQDFPPGSGRRIGVYLKWRAGSSLDASLKVFVHLLGPDGRPVAQDDGIPVLWTYPTSDWQPGEVVVDFHQFLVGADVPPGEYVLQAGLYKEGPGVRVKQVDAAGNPVDDKVVLTKIIISSE